ncbi:MAG: deoxyhypusine synthase family protein [Planctomycetes bacterium]|nr:deoxyhypusine synthase family protein [Planctomycetota bacterium]
MSPTRKDQNARCFSPRKMGGSAPAELVHKSVLEVEGLDGLLENCLPSFGGAYLRRLWILLDEAVSQGLPMTLSISGPVTVSGQHFAWLGPLLDTGWFAYMSTTDAVCYHDGHRALDSAKAHPFHEVAIFGDDAALRDEKTIRVTDIGFDEDILLDQDAFITAVLCEEEFQKKMTGTEFRWRLGRRYAAQEKHNGVREGLLALCTRKAIPIFVGAPGDGSVFLNSMKLWALAQLDGARHDFDLDLHKEVFESCAYHYWGLRESDSHALGTLILGGGVPKNYNLQPEPALSQILGLPDIAGYLYDVQITTAPVTDGSLSSCPPAEAVTWGKVDKDNFKSTCESMQCDYSVVMPFLVKALLEKRARYERWAERMGHKALFAKHPGARGYLRDTAGYRLFDRRDELMQKLFADVKKELPRLRKESSYPLAKLAREPGSAPRKPAKPPVKSRARSKPRGS